MIKTSVQIKVADLGWAFIVLEAWEDAELFREWMVKIGYPTSVTPAEIANVLGDERCSELLKELKELMRNG